MKETKEPIKIKLTVAVVLFIIFLLVIGMLGMFVYYNSNSKKNEAIELFNKYAFFYIDLKKDINNVDEIKQKIMQLRYVKSVEIDSNEGKLDEYNSMRNKYNLSTEYNANIFSNSFYVKFKFESKDLDNIKEIQNSLINEIINIKEVDKIENSRFNHFINVYNNKGIDGLKLICKFYEETDNMDSKEILKYYEDNQDFVNEYSEYLY